MKKLLSILITISIISCSNPLSKIYTEEGFMLDMVEIRESESEETVKNITTYIMQEAMRDALKDDDKKENNLVGKSYKELLVQADELAAKMKEKEEEEKRLKLEEERRRKEISLKISESITFALTKKGYSEYNYQDYITYTFTFENKSNKDILGVKGSVTFYDIFDEKIKSLSLSYDDGIKSKKTVNYRATTDYNQFMSEDKKLKDTELNKLKVVWEPEQLIFSDGEKISLN
jgi:hypothetical protein|tara:strand:- start:27 stop:722 length:696 start_codon:yes stop_codon:yes gene_type:complete